MRELATQFLALAEKQGATVPAHGRASPYGHFLAVYGRNRGRPSASSIGQSRFTTLSSIVRWRLGLAKTFGWQSYRSESLALWMLGYPEAALADADQALKDAREIGQAATLMYALSSRICDPFLCGNYEVVDSLAMNLSLWRRKGRLFWKAVGMLQQGCVLALTGKARDAVQMITSGITAFRSTGATCVDAVGISHIWREPMRNSANSMMLGAALAKR